MVTIDEGSGVSFVSGGYVRVTNVRKDMSPDGQPDPDESVLPVGRTNLVLGNRHFLRNKLDSQERDRMIALYDVDLENDFAVKGPMYRAILAIAERVMKGEKICLQCHCVPLRCHAHSIARKVNELVEMKLANVTTTTLPPVRTRRIPIRRP